MNRPTLLLLAAASLVLDLVAVHVDAANSYNGICTIVDKEDNSLWSEMFMVVEVGHTLEAICRCNLDAPKWKIWAINGTELTAPPESQSYCIGCDPGINKDFLTEVVPGRYLQLNLSLEVNEALILQCSYAESSKDSHVEASDKIVISVPESTKNCSIEATPTPPILPSPSPILPSPSCKNKSGGDDDNGDGDDGDDGDGDSGDGSGDSTSSVLQPTTTTCSDVTITITQSGTDTVSVTITATPQTTPPVSIVEQFVAGIPDEGIVVMMGVLVIMIAATTILVIILVLVMKRKRKGIEPEHGTRIWSQTSLDKSDVIGNQDTLQTEAE